MAAITESRLAGESKESGAGHDPAGTQREPRAGLGIVFSFNPTPLTAAHKTQARGELFQGDKILILDMIQKYFKLLVMQNSMMTVKSSRYHDIRISKCTIFNGCPVDSDHQVNPYPFQSPAGSAGELESCAGLLLSGC